MCVPLAALVPAVLLAAPQASAATAPSGLWNFSVASGSNKVPDIDGSAQNLTLKGWSTGLGYVNFNSAPSYGTTSQANFSPGDLEFAFGAVIGPRRSRPAPTPT